MGGGPLAFPKHVPYGEILIESCRRLASVAVMVVVGQRNCESGILRLATRVGLRLRTVKGLQSWWLQV